MNRALAILPVQVALAACVVLMGVWVEMPWPALVGLGLLSVGAVIADGLPGTRPVRRIRPWTLTSAWIGTFAAPGALFVAPDRAFTLDSFHAVMAWLLAAILLLTNVRVPRRDLGNRWKILGMVWALFGSVLWLVHAYLDNLRGAFQIGLLIGLGLLIVLRLWFRMPRTGVLAVNTLVLLIIGLPTVDLFIRPPYHLTTQPAADRRYYSYEAAKKNPGAFAHWWRFYLRQWVLMGHEIYMRAPETYLPFRLRPDSRGMLFQSRIHINNLGFRGPEFSLAKHGAYRIVALGESTTFGCTIHANGTPWPVLLERMIGERLNPSRPVQVINAGVPSYDLAQNVRRLATDILPLTPDMIISYHGYNGFHLLTGAPPRSYANEPPRYRERPLRLLADCEYRWKMFRYRQRQVGGLNLQHATFSNPMQTAYAHWYQRLIHIAKTNKIRLVLANFSMAVNGHSGTRLIEFYRLSFPAVYWQIKANVVHSTIVRRLTEQHPEVCFVNTHPHLDGEHQKFIDLVHLTQEGRRQLAENIFAGIKDVLEKDLSRPVRKEANSE